MADAGQLGTGADDLSAKGSGRMVAWATDSALARATGNSRVEVRGNPRQRDYGCVMGDAWFFPTDRAPTPGEAQLLRTLLQEERGHKVTLEEMSRLAGYVSASTWGRIESGERPCDLTNWVWALLMTGHHPTMVLVERGEELPSR